MRVIISIIFISILGNIIAAQNLLDQYLEIAAKNNPELKAQYYEYLAALEVVPQVGSLPDPQLAFGYFIQPVETRLGPQQARISLSQMLPWLGTLNAKKEVEIQRAKAKYEEFEETKSNLYFKLKSAYYNLYFLKKAIEITDENLQILNSSKNLVLIKIKSGVASAVDELRIEMEIAALKNQLELLKDKFSVETIKFNKLMYVEDTISIQFPDTLWNSDLTSGRAEIMAKIRSNNHQVQKLEFLSAVFKNQETVAKKSGMPGISIGIDYIFIGKDDNPMVNSGQNGKDAIVFPMVGLSIPLFRNKYNAMIKETQLKHQAMQDKKLAQINMLESLYEEAIQDYRDAQRRIILYGRQLTLSDQALKILQSEYATDGQKFEELLRMERSLLNYALELEKARADKQSTIAFTNYLIGN